MTQRGKTCGERPHWANQHIRETPSLNMRNAVNQNIIRESRFLCTMIRAHLLSCLFAQLDVVRIGVKNQNGCSLLEKALKKRPRQIGFACPRLRNNGQVATQSIGIKQDGNSRAVE